MTGGNATTNQIALSCIALYMLNYIELYTLKFSGYITTLGYIVIHYIKPSVSIMNKCNYKPCGGGIGVVSSENDTIPV